MQEKHAEVLVIGGGTGGTAAVLAALRLGATVILTEETDWIGGQLTAQAVPPDENPWIDGSGVGCTASYRQFRDGVRATYRRSYPLRPDIAAQPHLNPGRGNVSALCHEPRIGLAVLQEMLMPYIAAGRLTVLLGVHPVAAETDGDRVTAITVESVDDGSRTVLHAPYIIDATELGDVLALAGIEHVIGAESQEETNEPNALAGAPDPLDQQAHSWVFVLSYAPGENHTIDKPSEYDFWQAYSADFWPDRLLSWTTADPITLEPVTRPIFIEDTDSPYGTDLWHFRRIAYRGYYPDGFMRSDAVVVNWPQIDYWLGPLVGVSSEESARHWHGARALSLSMLYWMQTEAPRSDGGCGYPGLYLRPDLAGTADGLAKSPYIRESRRLRAMFTVLEQHVGVQARGKHIGSEQFHDSVGIGSYRIDLHPSYRRSYLDINNYPHQIPLGALIPQRVENVLAGGKNLGVTHITNGCYRLHPIEWNIGEAAGALAAYCVQNGHVPQQVRSTPALLTDFQHILTDTLGIPLAWPEAIRVQSRDKLDPLGI